MSMNVSQHLVARAVSRKRVVAWMISMVGMKRKGQEEEKLENAVPRSGSFSDDGAATVGRFPPELGRVKVFISFFKSSSQALPLILKCLPRQILYYLGGPQPRRSPATVSLDLLSRSIRSKMMSWTTLRTWKTRASQNHARAMPTFLHSVLSLSLSL